MFYTLFKCLRGLSQVFQWWFPKSHVAFLRCQAVGWVHCLHCLAFSNSPTLLVFVVLEMLKLNREAEWIAWSHTARKDRAEIQNQAIEPWRPHPYSPLNLLIIETGTMLLSILEMTDYNTERVNDFPHLSKLKRKKEPASLILGRFEQTSTHSGWEWSTNQRKVAWSNESCWGCL